METAIHSRAVFNPDELRLLPTRKAVELLADRGLDQPTIAAYLGTNWQTVRLHLSDRKGIGSITKRRNDAGRRKGGTDRNYCDFCRCGRGKRETAAQCRECDLADRTIKANYDTSKKLIKLEDYANKLGYIPTCDQAGSMLGLSRSQAGIYLQKAFGKDNRDGYLRRAKRELV